MSKLGGNLQDGFLNQARRENVLVTVYLVNGYQLRGRVVGFDNFTVILEGEGKQHLVYKHAISTVTPQKSLHIFPEVVTKGEAVRAEVAQVKSGEEPNR